MFSLSRDKRSVRSAFTIAATETASTSGREGLPCCDVELRELSHAEGETPEWPDYVYGPPDPDR